MTARDEQRQVRRKERQPTCTKRDIVAEVSNRTGIDLMLVHEITQAMFEVMCEGLAHDGDIEIRNFGIFRVKQSAPRRARNPRTNQAIMVGPKTLIHFKPGQLMRAQLNVGENRARPSEESDLDQNSGDTPPRPPRITG